MTSCKTVTELREANERIAELEKKCDELAAHCERLTRHINKLDKHAYDHMEGGVLNCCVKKEFFESATQAAQQSLAKRDADLLEKAIEGYYKGRCYGFSEDESIVLDYFREYADKIERGDV